MPEAYTRLLAHLLPDVERFASMTKKERNNEMQRRIYRFLRPLPLGTGAGAGAGRGAAYDEEAKDGEEMQAAPDGEYHDYVMKEGGGSSMFGRKSWKKRFLVLKNGEIGWFKTYKDYAGRWTGMNTVHLLLFPNLPKKP